VVDFWYASSGVLHTLLWYGRCGDDPLGCEIELACGVHFLAEATIEGDGICFQRVF
jgi:hypothetical protein